MCIGKTYVASSAILEPYLRGTDGFLLVYDVTNRDSFEFLRTAHTKAFGYREAGKPVWVYGARTDRPQMERMVSAEEGEEFCENIEAKFLRVPAYAAQVLGQAVIEEMTGRAIVSKMSREAASAARRENMSKDLSSVDPAPRQRGFSISSLKDKLLHRK
ncbi:hypothetical protein B0J13DRAFT_549875 [Dactylonectria estremocensis]|uniref:Uncharacterized protein n=1 Tax=Dactylonectria estremocensis TaxID=1079267 RepID=A0A9P9F1C4_9HYPO|nr:hypothetical protein B0J13DRAFT_549875 [Dactylonectria estremocensis]